MGMHSVMKPPLYIEAKQIIFVSSIVTINLKLLLISSFILFTKVVKLINFTFKGTNRFLNLIGIGHPLRSLRSWGESETKNK